MVGFLHLKESEAFLDNSPVLRVSEAVPEVDPDTGDKYRFTDQVNVD